MGFDTAYAVIAWRGLEGSGLGSPDLSQAINHAAIASCNSISASYSVRPQALQPGKSWAIAI